MANDQTPDQAAALGGETVGGALPPLWREDPQVSVSGPPAGFTTAPRGWLGIVAVAVVAALVGGGVGGVVGYRITTGTTGFNSLAGPPGALERVAAAVLPTVVQIRVHAGHQIGTGSGIVLSPEGVLLTNNHVIADAAGGAGQISVLFADGTSAPAQIIGRDPTADIAVVKASNVTGLTPIALGDSDSLRVGQPVVAVGAPLGLGGTVTTGIVSGLNRAVSVGGDNPTDIPQVLDAIQTNAAINPGNSGGPLVDIQGRLIGINTAIASIGGTNSAQGGSVGLGFSIPINQVKRIADQLERTGQATTAILGVGVIPGSRLIPLNDPPGATVAAVTPNGPASKAGLKTGDVIVKVNNRPITYGEELVAAIRALSPGDTVTLQLSDGRTVPAVLDSQPVPASK